MIAKDLLDFLNSDETLNTPAYMEVPKALTDFILLDQTGTSTTNHIKTTTIAVQSYGKTLWDAMQLNEKVKDAMQQFVWQDNVARVELETDYNFTNTETKQYRWQAVFQITHY